MVTIRVHESTTRTIDEVVECLAFRIWHIQQVQGHYDFPCDDGVAHRDRVYAFAESARRIMVDERSPAPGNARATDRLRALLSGSRDSLLACWGLMCLHAFAKTWSDCSWVDRCARKHGLPHALRRSLDWIRLAHALPITARDAWNDVVTIPRSAPVEVVELRSRDAMAGLMRPMGIEAEVDVVAAMAIEAHERCERFDAKALKQLCERAFARFGIAELPQAARPPGFLSEAMVRIDQQPIEAVDHGGRATIGSTT